MQEQNFEKQVHKLMDDLLIPPSPPVWDRVEEQISRKKDRRRIVLWLLPVLLVSSGLLWWTMSSDKEEFEKKTDSSNKVSSTSSKQPNINSTIKTSEPGQQENFSASPKNLSSKNIVSTHNKKNKFSYKSNGTNKDYAKTNTRRLKTIEDGTKNDFATRETQIITPPVEAQKGIVPNNSNEQSIIQMKDSAVIEKANLVVIVDEKNTVDSAKIEVNPIETEMNEEPVVSKNLNQLKASTKWKLIPYLATGFSNVSKGLFDPVAAADFAGPVGNTSGSGSSFAPSVPQKAAFFSAGLRIVKTLHSRIEIGSGLQYNYFSTKQNIGTRVITDTTISFSNGAVRLQDYYRNGNANRYTNKYHFISLPLNIEYQLLRNIPLSVQAGFSINQLIYTNALLYNNNSTIQFENNKAWNKTQIQTVSGLQYHFLKKKSFSFKAGPFIHYSLTSLEKNSPRKQFLSAAGLQTHFYFQNKK